MYLGPAGMVCSVGLSAPAACAAMRAGIAKFDELPYLGHPDGSIAGACVPGLDRELQLRPRLVEMLAMALRDCLGKLAQPPMQKIPLLVGLAEPGRPGGGALLAERIISDVQEKVGIKFHPGHSRVISKGHTAGFEGLRIARELLQAPDNATCLVCAVDSFLNEDSFWWLDMHWRLKHDDHSDGVIPGEAAAALLVQRQASSKAEPKVAVIGLGFGQEKATVTSEEPLLGLGLAGAARAALAEAKVQMNQIGFRLADVTGESYGFKEQALALSRLMRAGPEELPLWHMADSMGDCGAAAGICQLVIAREAFCKGYAPGDRCACYSSAVPGDRAVAVLQRQRD